LPTFDRPRNAISGTLALGNCAAETAESMNSADHRIARNLSLESTRRHPAEERYVSATASGLSRSVRSVGTAASSVRV
jgi:hypothetical protein